MFASLTFAGFEGPLGRVDTAIRTWGPKTERLLQRSVKGFTGAQMRFRLGAADARSGILEFDRQLIGHLRDAAVRTGPVAIREVLRLNTMSAHLTQKRCEVDWELSALGAFEPGGEDVDAT